ncbi:MAG: glycosyltransferase [Myxococcota bacterium]|nr:glycosyltransferase [Myxococcota bacterium]
MTQGQPTVALCVIARDEEAMIGACLASAWPAVDQVVVIDTGSSDNTAAIARAAGAEVHPLTWTGDFSAARNEALKHVRCDWVLVLDCDERLASWASSAIREGVRSDRVDAYVLPLTDASELAAPPNEVVRGRMALRESVWLLRLFRFSPDLRWEGCVHEHVRHWLRSRGGRVGTLDAPIAHYGAVPSYREQRGNSERNLELLLKQVQEDPDHWFAQTYLLEELMVRNDMGFVPYAEALSQRLHSQLLPVLAQGRAQHGVVKALTAVGVAFLRLCRFQEVEELVAAGKRAGVIHPNVDYLEGLAHENQAHGDLGSDRRRLESAKLAYLRVLGADEQVWLDPLIGGIRSWNGLLRLSTVFLQLGHAEDALEGFELALQNPSPAHLDLQLGRSEALISLGRFEEALIALNPLMQAHPRSSDLAILVAEALDGLGRFAASSEYWKRARQTASVNLQGLHRLQRLNLKLAELAS